MIYFSDQSVLPILAYGKQEKYFILNFYSNISLGTPIPNLYPSYYVLSVGIDSPMFETEYVKYILSNTDSFCDMMEIMMAQYYNNNVIVLTDFNNKIVDLSVSCLINLIRNRYGIIPYIVHDIDDILESKESNMSDIGQSIFLSDKELYIRNTVDPKKLLDNAEMAGEVSDKYI